MGIWSDDLDAIGANPMLIQLKRALSRSAIDQAQRALHVLHPPLIMIVYIEGRPSDTQTLRKAHFPVLAIALPELLERMRTSSFAEVVRDLRNRSVHGLPKS